MPKSNTVKAFKTIKNILRLIKYYIIGYALFKFHKFEIFMNII